MMNRRNISTYRLLEEVAGIEDKDKRRTALRTLLANKPAIALLIQYAYHPDVKWDLPPGDIPTTEWTRSSVENPLGLQREAKKLKTLWVGRNELSAARKQISYVYMLNSLEGKDAELLISIVGGRLPYKTLNGPFVRGAVPELFPGDAFVRDEKEAVAA